MNDDLNEIGSLSSSKKIVEGNRNHHQNLINKGRTNLVDMRHHIAL